MAKPDYLDQLITKAMRECGSDAALARRMGLQPSAIGRMRNGDLPAAVQEVLLLATIAGLEPEAWAARQMIWKYRDTPREQVLVRELDILIASDHRGEQFKWAKRRIKI